VFCGTAVFFYNHLLLLFYDFICIAISEMLKDGKRDQINKSYDF
jgi:hypothetical protein